MSKSIPVKSIVKDEYLWKAGSNGVSYIKEGEEAGHMSMITVYLVFKTENDEPYIYAKIYPHGHEIEYFPPSEVPKEEEFLP